MTIDEPSHLTSAFLYWHGRDRLYPRDMPPLIKIVAGWPSALIGLPVADELGKPGDKSYEWTVAAGVVRAMKPDQLQQVLFWSRVPMVIFPLALTFLLWWWSRALFGPQTALILTAFWVMLPTPLAHGALLKNDIAAAFTYLLFWYAAWSYWRAPSHFRAAGWGVATALVLLSKLSMLFVCVFPLVLILIRRAVHPKQTWRTALGSVAIVCGVAYLILIAAYQFELHWLSKMEIGAIGLPRLLEKTARLLRWIPVPEGMWAGAFSLLVANSHDSRVFLMGQIFLKGHPAYFAIAMLFKYPLPAQILLVAGLALAGIRSWRRRFEGSDALWLLPGFLYFGLASMSSLQLGVRLVLPSWPFFLLISGIAVQWLLRTRVRQCALAALVVSMAAISIANYPHGISHLNRIAGPPEQAWRLLNDSNIDWGQALPEVAEFVRGHNIEKLHLSYFGFDQPERFFKPGQIEYLVPPWSDEWVETERVIPKPGWYAISACMLPGHFFAPKYRDYYAEFQLRKPIAAAGGSMFIYRID